MTGPAPIKIFPVPLKGEVAAGDNLGDLLAGALKDGNLDPKTGDVLVVTQKIVSKAEDRIVELDPDDEEAKRRLVESESKRILRRRNQLTIAETRHGFVCASAGIDSSNVAPGSVALLPLDPDLSARRIRARIKSTTGIDISVIISDTFGRPWRMGQTDVAIGIAGFHPLKNYLGAKDGFGQTLWVTNIAVADEIAGAAELVMGKADNIPAALLRGAAVRRGRGSSAELVRRPQDDLFR